MTKGKASGTVKMTLQVASGGVRSSSSKGEQNSLRGDNKEASIKGRRAIPSSLNSTAKLLREGNGSQNSGKPIGGRKTEGALPAKAKSVTKSAKAAGSRSRKLAESASMAKRGSKANGSAQRKNGASQTGVKKAVALESIVKEKEKLLKAKARAILASKLDGGSSPRGAVKRASAKSVSAKNERKTTVRRTAQKSSPKATKVEVAGGKRKPTLKGEKSVKAPKTTELVPLKAASGEMGEGVGKALPKSPSRRKGLSSLASSAEHRDDKWTTEELETEAFDSSELVGEVKVGGGNGTLFSDDEIEALLNSTESLLTYKPSRRQRSGIPDAMTLWGRELHKRPLLTHEQEIELAKRMEKGDEEARRIFIESNYRLVVSIAQKYRGCGVPLEDLIQAGNIGLIQAVDHYDWRQGTRFSTCAVMWIRQAILRAIDSHARIVRLSMRVSEQVHRVAAARQALIRELGRDPTIDEIARRARLSKERVKELMGYMAQKVISLDDPVDMADGLDVDEVPSFSEYLADDQSSNPEEIIANREMKQVIDEAIRELPDRTQHALKLRFGFEDGVMHTYDEIGYQLGLSRQRAMQLVQLGLQQLREHPKVKMLFPK